VPGERLSASEKRGLLLWVVLGIIGTIFAYKYFFRAFPEASVDFHVTRGEALKLGQNFVAGLGENVSGYRSAIVFSVDDDGKTYLERELGLQQANQLMSSQLHLWYWDVRFFRPLQEEEFFVRVSPAGQIVGYTHKIEEARPGATLDRAAAEATAQNFVVSKLGQNPSEWDFLLRDLQLRLAPRGKIYLTVNPLPNGDYLTPELRQFFSSRGADIERERIFFAKGVR